MFTSTLKCLLTSRFLKYARHHTFTIRTLRHIRSSLTTDAAKTIASAIVGLRLDYCNSLLAGTSAQNLSCLQLVQNTLARVSQSSKILLLSHHTGSDRPTLAPGPPANRFQNCYHCFQGLALVTTFLPS